MENSTNQRTDYERGYRDGYRDGMSDRVAPKQWPGTSPNICHKCGMQWSGVMGYVCPHQDCLIQPKIIAASNNEWLGNDPEWKKEHDRSKY